MRLRQWTFVAMAALFMSCAETGGPEDVVSAGGRLVKATSLGTTNPNVTRIEPDLRIDQRPPLVGQSAVPD